MKKNFRATTGLAPVPVVMVSCGDMERSDIITIAWVGTVNSEPPMLSVSIRKSRLSYDLIEKSGEFVVNLVTKELLKICDGCGIVSGRDVDKFKKFLLNKEASEKVSAPRIKESPVNLECVVKQKLELGSHDVFIAEIVNVSVDEMYVEKNGYFIPENELVGYVQNRYVSTGKTLGSFGFSVKNKK